MKISRLTISLGLAAVVSLFGLIEANASPFSMFFLADDLGDRVSGTAPEASEWENDGGDDTGGSDSGGGDASDGGDSGGGDSAGGSDNGNGNGNGNNGHGNNEDGVDSSNPSQGNGGPNGAADESCPEGGECVDDEASSSDGNSGSKGKKK